MKFTIFYRKAKEGMLLTKEVKGKYIYTDKWSNKLLIDNIMVADLDEVYQVTFMVNGYVQTIHINPYNVEELVNKDNERRERQEKLEKLKQMGLNADIPVFTTNTIVIKGEK